MSGDWHREQAWGMAGIIYKSESPIQGPGWAESNRRQASTMAAEISASVDGGFRKTSKLFTASTAISLGREGTLPLGKRTGCCRK